MSPFRTYDDTGRPVGFDWSGAILGWALIVVGIAAIVGTAVGMWHITTVKPRPPYTCRDRILPTGVLECPHVEHKLSFRNTKSLTLVCKCRK